MFHVLKKNFKILLTIVVTASTVIFASTYLGSADSAPLRVWTEPSMKQIRLNQLPGDSSDIQLVAARGEVESFQIGVRAVSNNVGSIDVDVSDLVNGNRNKISKNKITLYREHYINVPKASPRDFNLNPSQGAGWYPDALIPFKDPITKKDLTGAKLDAVPFVPKLNRNQPFWVDIKVPRGAAPGTYQGTYTVTSDRSTFTGKITLKVWDFTLPISPSLKSAFYFDDQGYPQLHKELLQHKMMPKRVHPDRAREMIDHYGLNVLRLPYWSGANVHTCQMKDPPSVETVRRKIAEYPKDLTLYVFSADEIENCQNLEAPLRKWAKVVRAAGAKHLLVTIPKPELHDDGTGTGRSVADIWVVKPSMYENHSKDIADVMKKGDEVWFYTGYSNPYSPKWLLDYPAIDFRIPQGFISQSMGIEGVLFWKTDLWTEKDPWKDITAPSFSDKNRVFPGDGMLLYPGQKVGVNGVVPSMRMKWIRDGIEDYEYIEILKKLGEKQWALQVSRSVGADWQNWTRDPRRLEVARHKLGSRIEAIMRERKR